MCLPHSVLFPGALGPSDPAGRPGRRPRLPLGGGPRSKFCLLLARGTLLPPPRPSGVVRGRVLGCAAPFPLRPPFGFLALPRPALLQPFLLQGRSVLISREPAATFLSPAPPLTLPWTSFPSRVGMQAGKWRPELDSPLGYFGAMKTHPQTFFAAPSISPGDLSDPRLPTLLSV